VLSLKARGIQTSHLGNNAHHPVNSPNAVNVKGTSQQLDLCLNRLSSTLTEWGCWLVFNSEAKPKFTGRLLQAVELES